MHMYLTNSINFDHVIIMFINFSKQLIAITKDN